MIPASELADPLDVDKLHFVDVSGFQTRYYEAGSGEPLVLIHGGEFGSVWSLDCWSLNFAGLSRRFHCYALDKLGEGHTAAPRTEQAFTFPCLMDHLIGFVKAVGLSSAHFVGHSRGGLLVTWLALEHSELVRSAIIVDSGTTAREDPRHPSNRFYEEVISRQPPGPPTRESIRARLRSYLHRPELIGEAWVTRVLEITRLPGNKQARRSMLAQGGSAGGQRVWLPSLNRWREEAWRTIDDRGIPVRTLLVWGADDVSAPLAGGLDLYDLIARRTLGAEMHIINQAGHCSFRDQVEGFNRAVTSFCLG